MLQKKLNVIQCGAISWQQLARKIKEIKNGKVPYKQISFKKLKGYFEEYSLSRWSSWK